MSLYFNYKVDVFPSNAIHVNASLHCQHKILAVASHSEDKGGTVTVCNDEVVTLNGNLLLVLLNPNQNYFFRGNL
jgi:hypothetical protein